MAQKQPKNTAEFRKAVLGFATGGVALALLFVAWVYPEVPTASYTMAALLAILLTALAWMNQRELKSAMKARSVRYGTNAAVTLGLVAGILVVLNFLNYNHYYRKDLTRNKLHSLSDQSAKILKDVKENLRLTVYVKTSERESVKPVIDNYLYLSKKISAEYVDPDRDPTRAKAANVKKYGTILVQYGKKDSRVEDATEEKITNAILKVLKDKAVKVCFLKGHGEKTPDTEDPESYSTVKKELASQNYDSRTLNLLEEAKVPAECTVLVVAGPTKAFFDKEISVLRDWLDGGGRALFALDPNLRSSADTNKDLEPLLAEWSLQVNHDLVIDPMSRLLGVEASVPIVGIYSKEHPITKDAEVTTLFPLASTVQIKGGAPASLKSWWLAKSTPKAFTKSDFKEILSGAIRHDEKKDVAGPHVMMAAVEGSRAADKKPAKPTRIVAMGTSQVAANRWAGHGANLDLFLNAVSWLADDESLISIRPKEEGQETPSLSKTEAAYIQLLTMFLVPGAMLLLGLVTWARRRKL